MRGWIVVAAVFAFFTACVLIAVVIDVRVSYP
jgi:hypothetical protein